MSRPILVTGASGFAGSHLLDLLSGTPAPIIAWRRGRPGNGQERPGVSWEEVDILDRSAVRASVTRHQPSAVYHCAGAAHVGFAWSNSEAAFATNVRGTHYLIDALKTSGLTTRVLIPSSSMVYATSDAPLNEDSRLAPASPYGLSKLAQELEAVTDGGNGLEVSVARAFNHFGPRQDPTFAASAFARQIATIEAGELTPEIAVGNLEARRDLTDVRDTVAAYQRIVDSGPAGRVYNVCSGRAVQIGELLDMLLARARVPIRVTVDPARYRPNDQPLVLGDRSRLTNELGWTPAIPLEQTIDDVLAYWRQYVAS